MDKKEVEVLKRARENFVRRGQSFDGRDPAELPVERAFRCRKPERPVPALAPTRLRAFIDLD